MIFDVLTIFPDLFDRFVNQSLIGKARKGRLIEINIHNLRDYCSDKHRQVDDAPYGGGPGMVLKPEPLFKAVKQIKKGWEKRNSTVLLSPQGTPLNQAKVSDLAGFDRLLLICGRYEGIDERVQFLIDETVSIGDYVLNGGELPAMVIMESVSRLLPGVLGDRESAARDSFSDGILDYPHYTRPAEYSGYKVPEILLSGDQAEIARWRRRKALQNTWRRRPDLLEKPDKSLSSEDRD
ncbi:MAG: tRNA (guanosine(37)-N1)-methyltransferase TrmD [bacterium]